MKATRSVVRFVLVLVSLLCVTSRSSADDKDDSKLIVGKWVADGTLGLAVQEFKEDGTWINDAGMKGSWRISNGQLAMSNLLVTTKRDFVLTKDTLKIADKNNKLDSDAARKWKRKK